MDIWYKSPVYTASHIAFGVLCFYKPMFFPVILVYHLVQYWMGIRFFIFERQIRQGNSIAHTTLKLGEVLLGLLIAHAIYTWNR